MKRISCICAVLLLASSFLATPAAAAQTAGSPRGASPPRSSGSRPADRPVVESPTSAKVVQYGEKDVVRINAKVRYTTLIVLPKNEEILDFTCGDKDFWIVNGNQNFAYVKPAKEGSQTNLNLITASGNVYSFVLKEVSEVSGVEADLKVFIETKEGAMTAAAEAPRTFVSARELEDWRQQVELAKNETRQVREASQAAIDAGISQFVTNVRFAYRFEAGKKPFYLRAMYHDDKFTFIQARPEETPTLYEIKDGKPNLVNFDYKNGVYVADKILERGYLVIGKKRLAFRREE